jgi:signal transduction histidine kinase
MARPGLSLFGRMLFKVGTAALFPLLGVIAIATAFAYRTVSEDSYKYASSLSDNYAASMSVRLQSLASSASALASAFSAFGGIPPAARRGAISAQLRRAMEALPDVLAAWSQWEPGAVGDDPRPFAGTMLATESGAFDATWYRVGGSIVQGAISDSAYAGDFYALPKSRGALTLIEPYRYSYTGSEDDEILETSICVPIVSGGAFKGVVGLDVDVGLFARIAESARPFTTGYGILMTGRGTIVGHPLPELIGTNAGEDLAEGERGRLYGLLDGGRAFTYDKVAAATGEASRVFFSPVRIEGLEDCWYFALVAPKLRVIAPARDLALALSALGAAAAAVVAVAILLASRSLSMPIAALADGARRVAAGELSHRVEAGGSGEVAGLAAAFNDMASRLEALLSEYGAANRELSRRNEELARAEASLRSLNADLEGRVAERTASLESANAELGEALAGLRAAQDGLEVSAKMAVVGRLAATIAHELNTPLGAVISSASQLRFSIDDFFDRLLPLYESLPEGGRALFAELARRGRRRAGLFDMPQDRPRRNELARRLSEAGVERARGLAEEIESLGAFDLEAEIMEAALGGGEAAIAAAARSAAAARAIAVILEASEKAARTVSALSNYSREGELDEIGTVDPAEDIDNLLALYYGRTKRSVLVERRYEPGARVAGYRDRLKEVWVNLMNNALQAMDYSGRLGVAVAREGAEVVVSFSDTGPGIAEENRNKIFRPFFTTKAPGEGTGLGLDICKRIVERHGGSISFESGRGGTVFSVRLPAAEDAREGGRGE